MTNYIYLTFLFLMVCVVVACVGVTIYGLIVAFVAHIVIGLIFLLLEPMPFITGMAMIFWGYNIPEMVLKLFSG